MPSFKEYTMMFQLSAATSAQFSSAFSGAQSQITQLQSKIDALNKQQGDITAYQKQQTAVEKTKAKLELLKQQYENLRQAQEKAGGSDVDLQNKMLDKQHQIDKTNASLEQQEARLDRMGTALENAGVDTQNLTNESQRLETELGNLRSEQDAVADAAQESSEGFAASAQAMQQMLVAAGVVDLLKNIGGALKECADASIQYESAMAGVKRTVGGSDAFISGLGDDFKYLSTVIPITSTELASIATTAGQLGIAQDDVSQFTEVMAKLATTTDLTADDAATMLAQFANITGTKDYERLGSTVASLGDATATTASKVVQMSQGLAASASQAGMSETDILGISAAVGSLGIEAQAGSTAMSTLISTLYKSVETGDKLEQFAAVANMTASQFKTAWAEDAAGAMNSFIMGLNDVERNGRSAVVILDELGINNVRQTKAILGLASAEGLLTGTIHQANQAWQENTALDEKASIMYETTEAKLNMMQNAFSNIKIAVGDALTPAVGGLAEMASGVMEPIAEFLEKNPAVVRALTAGAAVLAGVTGTILGISAALKVASVAAGMFSVSLGPVFAITAGLAGLTAVAVGLGEALGGTSDSFEDLDAKFDDTLHQIEEQQQILDLCDEYRQLQKELGYTSDDLDSLGHEDVGITFTATIIKDGFEDESDIALIKELADNITDDKGELKQLLEINGADSVTEDNLNKIVDLAADIATDDGILRQELALIGVEDISDTDLQTIRDLAAEITDKRGELSQAAKLIGLENVTDADIHLIADLSDAITTSSGELKQLLQLKGADDVTDADISKIINFAAAVDTDSGELRQKLEAIGVKNITDADIDRIQELAQNIQTDNGKLSETLSLIGFDNYDDILAACGLADEVRDANVSSTVSITLENLDDTVAHLNDLASQLSTAKDELTTAQADLADLEDQYRRTQNKMLSTNEKDEKAAYAEQLEGLSEAIVRAKDKVTYLETAYNNLNAEYETGSAALEEFNAKQARAAEIAAQLGISAGEASSGIASETEALNAQLETVEAIAVAKQAELRSQLYDNATAQAKKYAQAVAENNELLKEQEPWNRRVAESQKFLSMNADEVNASYKALLQEYDAMAAAAGDSFDPASEDAQSLMKDINNLMYLLGDYYGDLSQYADGSISLFDSFGDLETTGDLLNEQIAYMDEMIAFYGSQIAQNQEDIDTFIQNIVNGVNSGAITIEEAGGLINRVFSGVQDDGELVEKAMNAVADALADSADSADDMSDGVDDATASALELQNAITPIISKMDELSQAYADAYKSAEDSLSGQFELFEQVDDIQLGKQWVNEGGDKKKSDESMREALESQAKYFEEYNSMLQQAQSIGINMDLLSQLADGSRESAETLKYITEGYASGAVTAEDINSLNGSYERLTDAKTDLAQTMADVETNYTTTMDNLQSELESTIGEMDMSTEAAEASRSTFQAMADEADDMLPTVRAAYQRIAAAAQAALDSIHMPEISVPGTGDGVDGHAAGGTRNAMPGLYQVGEHGPELMWMNGGEQVFTAQQTAAILANANNPAEAIPVVGAHYMGSDGSSYVVTLSPVYNISGSANALEIETILKQHDADLIETVKNELADMEVDKARRSYT